MSKFLLTSAVALFSVGVGSAAITPKVPTPQLARHVGEQHLHAALKDTHAAEKAEKAGNTKAALADAQRAIQLLHQAVKAFDHNQGKGNAAAKGKTTAAAKAGKGAAAQQHPHHVHIQAAIRDLQAAEKLMQAGKVGKAEHDLHKAATQIQDAIKAHQAHHNNGNVKK